jgi:prepilin-type N-terminal cleavage/methylation domain-containing protein
MGPLFLSIRRFVNSERGVSLPELMVAITLISITSTVLLAITINSMNMIRDIETRATADRETQVIANNLAWELRSAQKISEDNPVLDIAEGNQIQFYRAKNLGDPPTRFRYYLDGGDLFKGKLNATGTAPAWTFIGSEEIALAGTYLTNDQAKPLFRYYDESGAELFPGSQADREKIRKVRISAMCDTDVGKPPAVYTVTLEVDLRNQS